MSIALSNLARSANRLKEVEELRYNATELATEYKELTRAMTRSVMAFVATEQPEFQEAYVRDTAILQGRAPDRHGVQKAMIDRFKKGGFTQQEMAKLEAAYAQSLELAKTEKEAISTVSGQFDDGKGGIKVALPNALMAKVMIFGQQYTQASTAIDRNINEFIALQTDRFAQEVREASVANKLAYRVAASAIIALLLCSALALWALYKIIKLPLDQGVQLAQRLAAGDLGARVDLQRRDELGKLLEALNGIGIGLNRTVSDVRDRSRHIADASHHISAGNQELSLRTDEQAANLQETATAMEQLSATVKQNADNTEQAKHLVTQTAQCATRGSRSVQTAMDTMELIRQGSRKMAEITGLINNIAFHTNILSLNAAVEAARAGSHGKGFAVVAAEVRSLALRSAEASKDIESLIRESVAQMDAGADLVDTAGSAMAEIVQSVQQVQGIMNEIADASHAQAGGIQQITLAVGQLDSITQQNAAQVQEAAKATLLQQAQADGLAATIGKFKLDDSRDPAVSTQARDAIENPGRPGFLPAPGQFVRYA